MKEHRRPQSPSTRRKADPAPAKRTMLARALSKLGYCSRTQAEAIIASGRVTLGGHRITDPQTWVDLSTADIAVDGKAVIAEGPVYLMLNKPRGLVTTRRDPEGRATVFDCLRDQDRPHLSPVGRLDKASEGLLLFTNDTVFAQALLDPETHVAKTYHVQINRIADAGLLDALRQGVSHDDEWLRVRDARLLREGGRNSWLEITLDEGRNRQIRRMLEAMGIDCLRLIRVAIGNLSLGSLQKGEVRPLTSGEIEGLRKLIARTGGR